MASWTVLGTLLGQALAAACLALALYLLAYLVFAYRLHRWLVNQVGDPPEGIGAWQGIFAEFHRLKQRDRKHRRGLKNIIDEFHASTAALPDGAVAIDVHGRIVWFNQAASTLLGLRAQQDRGQRIANLMRHPRFAEYLAAGGDVQREVEIPSPVVDEGVVSLRVIPYGNDQRLLIARDVSAQKRLDATRRDFVANASHELRTPLTVLRGYLDMMREETEANGALVDWASPIQDMSGQAQRMQRIIEGLLELARAEDKSVPPKQQLVDVPALIAQVMKQTASGGARRMHVDAQVDAGLFLYGRASELESIFANLIQNAVHYTPDDGDITVRWALEDGGPCFVVTDSGIGIEADHIPRLTERFYRVDASRTRARATAGIGLGLSIVKHCLEHHEARLEIASEPNVGSSFTCRFPRQRARPRNAA